MAAFEPPLFFAESPLTFAGRPHKGQRSDAPHRRAGHMTAPDHFAGTALKALARGGRPHMSFAQPASRAVSENNALQLVG
jgi:hypothetical protein